MAQCLIHEEATTPSDALTLKLNVSEEKKNPVLHDYMPECVHFNYLTLEVGDISAEQKAFWGKKNTHTRQADSCKHEGSGIFFVWKLVFSTCPHFVLSSMTGDVIQRAAALCLSACEVVLHTER